MYIGAVESGRPPECEAAVRDLVETGALRVGELLELHRLLEARGLLPEQTLPRREVRALEERVLEDALHAAQRLDHVRPVVVQVPQFACNVIIALYNLNSYIQHHYSVNAAFRMPSWRW